MQKKGNRKSLFPFFFLTLFLLTSLSVTIPFASHAAAWLMEQGKGQFINNLFFYSTDEVFLPSGTRQRQPRFTKLEYNPYIEYGWKKDMTVGFSTRLQRLTQDGVPSNSGLGDTEFFLRQRLWNDERSVISIQPLLKLPGPYDDTDRLPLGQGQVDGELRLLGGTSFPLFGQWHYYNLEAGYRKRLGRPSDEWHLDQTLGVRIAKEWQVMLQNDNHFAVGSTVQPLVLGNSSDYDLVKLQISLVRELEKGGALQLGAFRHVEGKNTGAGDGFVLSYWIGF